MYLPMLAVPEAWVGSWSSVYICSECSCCKRKMAWAINTKDGRHTFHGGCLACVDPGQKSLGC